jgi:uncharacterized membrane protein YphA (DoxX/SURF4 family)
VVNGSETKEPGMHVTAHQIAEEVKAGLVPAALALGVVLVIPILGTALFLLRGFAAVAFGLMLAFGLLHFIVTRHRTTNTEDDTHA